MTTLAVVPDAGPEAPVLEGRGLTKSFSVKRGRGMSRGAARGSTRWTTFRCSWRPERSPPWSGESGSGKTTVARMLARIMKPDAGDVLLDGKRSPRQGRGATRAQVQMVFQDPFASLNPVHRIRYHLARPLQIHHTADGDVEQAVIAELLHRVALDPPAKFAGKFPHELSGGQRQRVAIARALAVRPRVLLADEPVSMLDVSIRLGVLNLLADLRDREQLAILYVTHDIASARYLADTIVVMYAGQLVEGRRRPPHRLAGTSVYATPAIRGAGSGAARAPVCSRPAERHRACWRHRPDAVFIRAARM